MITNSFSSRSFEVKLGTFLVLFQISLLILYLLHIFVHFFNLKLTVLKHYDWFYKK